MYRVFKPFSSRGVLSILHRVARCGQQNTYQRRSSRRGAEACRYRGQQGCAYKNYLMEVEETITNNITVNMVSDSENIAELYEKAKKKIKSLANGKIIVSSYSDMIKDVCDWAWDEYWSQYREGC